MAINKIITKKQLNYIETLYLYTNLEDFITETYTDFDFLIGEEKEPDVYITAKDLEEMYSGKKYDIMLQYVYDNLLHLGKYLGDSNGRMWYKLPNYRIGIMPHDKAKKANQFNVEIQYEQHHMFSLDPKLTNLDLPFDGTPKQYHIKRIDVSQIVKTDSDYLTHHGFISPYRKIHTQGTTTKTETVYLGHRSSGNVFRMYNKTIELKADTKEHPINYKKIAIFANYFGDIEDLYTFELELHRKYLKPTFGVDTLADLDGVYKVYSEIVGKIQIYKDTDANRKLISQKHHDRIDGLLQFTEYKEFKRLKSKSYKPSENFLVKKVVDSFNNFEKSLSEPLEMGKKFSIVSRILSGIFVKFDDVTISFNDDDKEDFSFNVESLRDNQDNSLMFEAKKAFAPIYALNPKDLF
jgi:hypothetical protein